MKLARMYTPEESAAFVAKMGGIEKMFAGDQEHKERHLRLSRRREELTRKYPDQWLALAPGGDPDLEIAADTVAEVFAAIDARGIARDDCIIRRMRVKPLLMIPTPFQIIPKE